MSTDGQVIGGIYERNDSPSRLKEGLHNIRAGGRALLLTKWLAESSLALPPTHVLATENGLKFNLDLENGQKTGFSWIKNTTVEQFASLLHKANRASVTLVRWRALQQEKQNLSAA